MICKFTIINQPAYEQLSIALLISWLTVFLSSINRIANQVEAGGIFSS